MRVDKMYISGALGFNFSMEIMLRTTVKVVSLRESFSLERIPLEKYYPRAWPGGRLPTASPGKDFRFLPTPLKEEPLESEE
jgi:hypothetical protein